MIYDGFVPVKQEDGNRWIWFDLLAMWVCDKYLNQSFSALIVIRVMVLSDIGAYYYPFTSERREENEYRRESQYDICYKKIKH